MAAPEFASGFISWFICMTLLAHETVSAPQGKSQFNSRILESSSFYSFFNFCFIAVDVIYHVNNVMLRKSCKLTDADIIGPFYKSNSPVKATGASVSPLPFICPNSPVNDRLILNGTVRLTTDDATCGKPVRALLDIWHADPEGEYSNTATTSDDFVR